MSSDPCSVYIRVLTDTGFPVPTSGLPRSSAGTRVAPTPTPSQPTSIGLALNVSHDRLASRRRANKEFYWGHSRNIRQRAHSLALNCQKFAHRRLDEQRQQQLFYGSSSYNSSSTQTPVNLSRTNSNVGLNVSGHSGTHDSYGEERRPLLGPNRGHSVLITPHKYGTASDHLPQSMKNRSCEIAFPRARWNT